MYYFDEDTCPCKGANLSKFAQPVLLSILTKKELNGYNIIKEMENYSTFGGNPPDPTGVYRLLKKLVERELIEKKDQSEKDGLYSITPQGLSCLEEWKATLKEYQGAISLLVDQLD